MLAWNNWLLEKGYALLKIASRFSGGDRIDWGSGSGNDSIRRTTLDLNHLVYFGRQRPKHVLNVVDGIVSGEGDDPLRPRAKPAGLILVGENPAYIDAAIARLIGYTIARGPTVYHALYHRNSQFAGPALEQAPVWFVREGVEPQRGTWSEIESLHFALPRHWQRAGSSARKANQSLTTESCGS